MRGQRVNHLASQTGVCQRLVEHKWRYIYNLRDFFSLSLKFKFKILQNIANICLGKWTSTLAELPLTNLLIFLVLACGLFEITVETSSGNQRILSKLQAK